jgi:HEAT repeat protein
MEIKISAQEVKETLNTARLGATDEAVEAFEKLGMLKCREAAPILIARITDKDPQIRLVCVQESVDFLGKAALKHLVARLEDKTIQIGMAAASQLAYLGTQKAAEALICSVPATRGRKAGSNSHLIEAALAASIPS